MTGDIVVQRVVADHLSGEALSVEPLAGGFSGAGVYRVVAVLAGGQREVVVKIASVPDGPAGEEARIYGTHPGSLGATHSLLQSRGVPTFELLDWGMPSDALPFYWVAMSLLDGIPVHGHRPSDDPEGFYRMCGDALGTMHKVTRHYDGPVDLPSPHSTSWHQEFFGAFDRVVERELDQRGLADLARKARKFAACRVQDWDPATSFSLSHVDGLQGHGARRDAWRYVGHVDLEDVVFLDLRFALAGYELAHGGTATAGFWEAYRSHIDVESSYEDARPLMQLFLLVDWLWIEDSRESLLATIARAVDRS